MSADTACWDLVRKGSTSRDPPQLTIYSHGEGYVNASADTGLLDTPAACRVHVDVDADRLALEPTDADDPDGYAVTRDNREDHTGAGGDIRLVSALRRLGIDTDDIEETFFTPLDAEGEFAVADVSELTTAATRTGGSDRAQDTTQAADNDEEEDEIDEDDEPEGVACRAPDCERVFANEHGRNIHEGQAHGGLVDTEDHGGTDVPDPEDTPSHETVRDAADAVDTVQELAELLDVEASEARFMARDADVYSDLQDRPPRPGVDR